MRSLLFRKAKSLRYLTDGGGDKCDQSISETSNTSLGVVVWDRGHGRTSPCEKKQDGASKNNIKKKSSKSIKQKGESSSSSQKLVSSPVADANTDDRNSNSIVQEGEFRKVQGSTSLEGQIVKVLRPVNIEDKKVKYKKWHVKVQSSGKIKEVSAKFLIKLSKIDDDTNNTITNLIKPNHEATQLQQQDSAEKPTKKVSNKTKTNGGKKPISRRGSVGCIEKPQKKTNNKKPKPADSKTGPKPKDPVHPISRPKATSSRRSGLLRQMSTPCRLGSQNADQISNQEASFVIPASNKKQRNPNLNIQEWDSDSDGDSDGSMDFEGLFQQKSSPDVLLNEEKEKEDNDASSKKKKKEKATGLDSSSTHKKKGKETDRKKPTLKQTKSSQLSKKKKTERRSSISSSSPQSSSIERLNQSSPAFNYDVSDDTKESTNVANNPISVHQKSDELFNATDHLIQRVISRNKSLKQQRRKSDESSDTTIETTKKEILKKQQLLEDTQRELAAVLQMTIPKPNGKRKMMKRSKSAVVLSPTMKSRSKVTGYATQKPKDNHQMVEEKDAPKEEVSVFNVSSSLNDYCKPMAIEDVGGRRKGLQRSRSAVLPRDIALCEEEEEHEEKGRDVKPTVSSSTNSSSQFPPTATAPSAPPRVLARTSSRELMMRRNRTRSLRDLLQDDDSSSNSQDDLDCSSSSSSKNSVSEVSDEDPTPRMKKSNSLRNLGRKAFRKSNSCSNLGRTRSSKDNVRLDKEQKKSLRGKEERGSRLATLKLEEHKKNQPVLKKIAAMPLQPFRNTNSNTVAVKNNDDGTPRRGVARCLSGGNKLRMQ